MPRVPAWAEVDGERVLTSRQAYRLAEAPERVVVVGAGATGVEFAHILSSLGSQVTLLASRGRVLPQADAEAAAALEEEFAERGVVVLRGARARAMRRQGDGVEVVAEDGRLAAGSHALLAVGLQPGIAGLGLDAAGVALDGDAVAVDSRQRTSRAPHLRRRRCHRGADAVVGGRRRGGRGGPPGARPAGRRGGSSRAAQAVYTEPEIAWVGLQEARGGRRRAPRSGSAARRSPPTRGL